MVRATVWGSAAENRFRCFRSFFLIEVARRSLGDRTCTFSTKLVSKVRWSSGLAESEHTD